MKRRARTLFVAASLALAFALFGFAPALHAQPLPAKPARHFNDYARLVSPDVASTLDAKLAQFERDTSNQIVVAVFPKMNSASSVEDFTVRVAQSWGVGGKGRNNGAILFVFVQDRQAYISTGYGLEGALPDALCFQIINQELTPRFRAGDYAGGLTAAVDSMLAATRGEYTAQPTRGTGSSSERHPGGAFIVFLLFVIITSAISRFHRRHDDDDPDFPSRGRRHLNSGGWFGGGGGGFGGGSSGGGGGFSGGGGSFGGGGAGGKW